MFHGIAKNVGGVFASYCFFSVSQLQLQPIYSTVAAGISGIILIFTAINACLDFKSKYERYQREEQLKLDRVDRIAQRTEHVTHKVEKVLDKATQAAESVEHSVTVLKQSQPIVIPIEKLKPRISSKPSIKQ